MVQEQYYFWLCPLGQGQKLKYQKMQLQAHFKTFLMQLYICNQHYRLHGMFNNLGDLFPSSCPWGGDLGSQWSKQNCFFFNLKFDVGSFLVELFAIYQLWFWWDGICDGAPSTSLKFLKLFISSLSDMVATATCYQGISEIEKVGRVFSWMFSNLNFLICISSKIKHI